MVNNFKTALSNLRSFYNGDSYDASTNAGGMANGGHRANFISALQDVSVVGQGIDARTQAAIDAGGIFATSTDVETPAIGTMTFTVQTGKSFGADILVKVVSRSDATNFAIGPVTSYDGVTTGDLVLDVQTIGSGAASASDWDVYTWFDVAGGAADVSNAVNITLGVAAAKVQRITMTATGKTVTLPAATALRSGQAFEISNAGGVSDFAFDVLDSVGNFLAHLPQGAWLGLVVEDITTAAGSWRASLVGAAGTRSHTDTVYVASGLNDTPVAALDATHLFFSYGNWLAKVADITDPDTIVLGTEATLRASGGTNQWHACAKVSASRAVAAFAHGGTAPVAGLVIVADISGTTITPRTEAQFEPATATVTNVRLGTDTATTVLIVWMDATNTTFEARVADITDPDAVTFGSPVTLVGASVTTGGLVKLASPLWACLHAQSTSVNLTIIGVSGTVVTDHGDLLLASTGASEAQVGGLAVLDDGARVVALWQSSGQSYLSLARINSATSRELLTTEPILGAGAFTLPLAITTLTSNRIAVITQPKSTAAEATLMARVYDIVGSALVPRGEWREVGVQNGGTPSRTANASAVDGSTVGLAWADRAASGNGTITVIDIGAFA